MRVTRVLKRHDRFGPFIYLFGCTWLPSPYLHSLALLTLLKQEGHRDEAILFRSGKSRPAQPFLNGR